MLDTEGLPPARVTVTLFASPTPYRANSVMTGDGEFSGDDEFLMDLSDESDLEMEMDLCEDSSSFLPPLPKGVRGGSHPAVPTGAELFVEGAFSWMRTPPGGDGDQPMTSNAAAGVTAATAMAAAPRRATSLSSLKHTPQYTSYGMSALGSSPRPTHRNSLTPLAATASPRGARTRTRTPRRSSASVTLAPLLTTTPNAGPRRGSDGSTRSDASVSGSSSSSSGSSARDPKQCMACERKGTRKVKDTWIKSEDPARRPRGGWRICNACHMFFYRHYKGDTHQPHANCRDVSTMRKECKDRLEKFRALGLLLHPVLPSTKTKIEPWPQAPVAPLPKVPDLTPVERKYAMPLPPVSRRGSTTSICSRFSLSKADTPRAHFFSPPGEASASEDVCEESLLDIADGLFWTPTLRS